MADKYYTSEHVSNQYNKLTKNKKIEVLYEAIDIMGMANWRSRFDCIAIAMGYNNPEGERDTYIKR